ncbi:sodium calcium exchanger 2 [Lynx pardinus]|uniref:Sodium calcium exchanger 2 n=1 Tax=Lynx pardinus TaxID=191816 RepID=A0A485P2X4_LYNPA|nr:sodium calcium exchanger 2 [Lynx pardinus]
MGVTACQSPGVSGSRRVCERVSVGGVCVSPCQRVAGSTAVCTCQGVKTLQVKIVDDEEYEKKDNFFIELGQPQWLKRGISALLLNQGDGDRKLTAEEEEARRIAEMGKPVLGENRRLEVIIEESYDFKNTVDKLIKKTNLALVIGTHSWREQFLEAVTVSAGKWGGRREEREGGMGRQSAGEEKREMNRKRERGARRRGQRTIEKRKRTRTQRKRKK